MKYSYIPKEFLPFKYDEIQATPNYNYCNWDMVPKFAPDYPPEVFNRVRCFGIMLGRYFVSTYGRVYSLRSNRFLTPINNKGYKSAMLVSSICHSKPYKIHRLVAATFIPWTDDDRANHRNIVNHKNLIKSDNYVWNLEWVNNQENTNHAIENGAFNQYIRENDHSKLIPNKPWGINGEKSASSRLTNQQVIRICEGLEKRKNYGECCELAGINNNARNRNIICNIARGDRWQWLSCRYNIPKDNIRELTDYKKFIVPVCKLLAKKMRIVDIIKELNLQGDYDRVRMFISGIKNKKTYTKISNEYF